MRRVDGVHGPVGGGLERRHGQRAAHVVGQTLGFTHAVPQARGFRCAEQVVAQVQRRVVLVRILQLQRHAGDVEGVGLVGRVDVELLGGDVAVRVGHAGVGGRLLPAGQPGLQRFFHRGGFEVADGGVLDIARAVEPGVELDQGVARQAARAGERFFEGGHVAQVIGGPGIVLAGNRAAGQGRGLGHGVLDRGFHLALVFLELFRREVGVADDIQRQRGEFGQVFALGRHRDLQRGAAAVEAEFGLQRVQAVLDVLARQLGRAAREQVGHRAGIHALPAQVFFVAELDQHLRLHAVAARGLGQQRQLYRAVGQVQLLALRQLVDIFGRGVEGRRGLEVRVALIVLEDGGQVHALRLRGAHGLFGGNVAAFDAVALHQVRRRGVLHFGQRGLAGPVALQEEQAPVAGGDGLGQRDADLLRIAVGLFPCGQPFAAGAVELLLGERFFAQGFQRAGQRLHGGVQALARRELRGEHRQAGVQILHGEAEHAGGQLGRHQGVVEAAGGRVGQDGGGQVQRHEVGAAGGGDVVHRGHERRAARAAQRHGALAVLGRFDGVFGWKAAVGLGQLAQRFLDIGERRLRVEFARHDQHRVVGLVVLVIEGAQLRDVDVFNVGAGADGVLAVAVPLERHGLHLLHQDAEGAVFAAFHFVADHGHFRIQVFLGDQGIDHGVGLPAQVPLEGVGVGGEAGEIVGAVAGGRTVGLQAPAGEFAHGVARGRGALEQHVFQQVGHAGLAVVLVARAHQVGHVDGRGGL
ncbi:hypothetical protein FQZ97_670730 [compost metagenome]